MAVKRDIKQALYSDQHSKTRKVQHYKLEMRGKAQRDSPVLVLQTASSIAGLPTANLSHPYLRQHFSVTVQPTPTKFEVNIVR